MKYILTKFHDGTMNIRKFNDEEDRVKIIKRIRLYNKYVPYNKSIIYAKVINIRNGKRSNNIYYAEDQEEID